ncbi:50S ribosomal protein L29 [Candidatus Gribaldobacteria bacterium]|nr:50S ribosomal protein L29 [Candidatus Gribaldobacteria bacterium]
MKTKEKIRDLQRQNPKEHRAILLEKRESLRQLNFDLKAGKVKNVRTIRESKKDIARILTLLNKK